MREKAFTLIEVMVVMAIISILAGMMVPAVWRFWESEEIATTKQRLEDLKLAMVGNRTLVQDGVRRSFGFVGDNGELPFGNMTTYGGLKFLEINYNATYPKWSGPYMNGGFDRSTYTMDAWGRRFIYTPVQIPAGDPNRYVYAEIRSYGPDGQPNNDDDLVIYIEEKEVTPTARYKGKIPVTLTGTGSNNFSANAEVTYRDPTSVSATGVSVETLQCKHFSALGPVSGSFIVYSSTHTKKFPVGELSYKTHVYTSTDCSTGSISTALDSFYFIHDDVKEILLNFPQYNN